MNLPHITKRQKEAVTLYYRFRFVNRTHVQKIFQHKTPDNINAWLKDLVEKNYIARIADPLKERDKPAVYRIARNGIKWIRQQPNCNKAYLVRLYGDKIRSREFIKQCLFIADIYVRIKQSTDTSYTYTFYTQADFPENGVLNELSPRFGFIKAGKKRKSYYLCEIFNEKIPPYALQSRIRSFIEFFTEGEGTPSKGLPPRILFIHPKESTVYYIRRLIRNELEELDGENLSLYATSREEIRRFGLDEKLWKK